MRVVASSTSTTCASWRGAELPFYSSIAFSPQYRGNIVSLYQGGGHFYSINKEESNLQQQAKVMSSEEVLNSLQTAVPLASRESLFSEEADDQEDAAVNPSLFPTIPDLNNLIYCVYK